MKNNKWVLRATGIFLIILFVGYIIVYETFLHGKLTSSKVLLAKEKIQANDVLTTDNTYMADYPKDLLSDGVILNVNNALGKRAITSIAANEFFTEDKLEDARLKKNKEDHFFSIPGNWLVSVPGSLRRLDEVDVWLVKNKDSNSAVLLDTAAPVLQNKVVAFIKNAANAEVQGVQEPTDRLNAASTPSKLELSLTNEEFKNLKTAVESGYALMISY